MENIYRSSEEPCIYSARDNSWWYACPSCHNPIEYKQNRCAKCGQLIDWERKVPKEPELHVISDENTDGEVIDTRIFSCPNCKRNIDIEDYDEIKFCRNCGQALDWWC